MRKFHIKHKNHFIFITNFQNILQKIPAHCKVYNFLKPFFSTINAILFLIFWSSFPFQLIFLLFQIHTNKKTTTNFTKFLRMCLKTKKKKTFWLKPNFVGWLKCNFHSKCIFLACLAYLAYICATIVFVVVGVQFDCTIFVKHTICFFFCYVEVIERQRPKLWLTGWFVGLVFFHSFLLHFKSF